MAFATLRLRPGVNAELTPSQVEAGYAFSSFIRFRNGLAEKLGGWTKFYAFAVGGVPKAMLAWLDVNSNPYLGIGTTGTNTILGVIDSSSVLTSVTPQEFTSDFAPGTKFSTTSGSPNVTVDDPNVSTITQFVAVEFKTPVSVGGLILQGVYKVALNLGVTTYRIVAATNATSTTTGGTVPQFTTTSGSANVSVLLANHGLVANNDVNFALSTTVGGVTIFGTYNVTSITDANNFVITVTRQASASTSVFMNSNQAELHYWISTGPAATSAGYGLGTYGSGGYGSGSILPAQSGSPIDANDWTLDNWGEILIAVPEDGGVWFWQPNTGFSNATMLAGDSAPLRNTGAFVATETQILVCYGSTNILSIGVDQDPLLVKWSNQGDFSSFTPSTTSQAGFRRLSSGSQVVGGLAAPQFNLLWTDIGLWTMSYIGPPLVFGFTPIGFGCGLVAKHAVTRLGANIYWMSGSNFFVLAGGAPQIIPCTVWDFVFQDLNTDHQDRSFAWTNTPFNEVWFFFPRLSTGATEPDAYVKYNVMEGVWDYGVLGRTAGIDLSLLGQPIATTQDGIIYQHETSPDGDGAAINPVIRTGLFELSEGQDISFFDWVLPDMRWQNFNNAGSASIQVKILAYMYLSDTPITHGPFTVSQTTPSFNCRVRGRFVQFEISSSDIGSFWRLGNSRIRLGKVGRL